MTTEERILLLEGRVDALEWALKNFSTPTPSRTRFVPPAPAEVFEYGKSIGFEIDGSQFCDYYESVGWKIGIKPMRDWKSAVRTWKRRGATTVASPAMGNGKCCTWCGGNIGSDGRVRLVMLWKESLPWCKLTCYERWVRNGRVKK